MARIAGTGAEIWARPSCPRAAGRHREAVTRATRTSGRTIQSASFAITLTPPVIATPHLTVLAAAGEQPSFRSSLSVREGLSVPAWLGAAEGVPSPYVADFPGLVDTSAYVLGSCEAGQQTGRWLDVWSPPPIDVVWDSLGLAAPEINDPQADPIAWTLDSSEQEGLIVSSLLTGDYARGFQSWSVSQPAATSGVRPRHFEWPPERAVLLAPLEDADATVSAVAPIGAPRPYAEVVATQYDPGLMAGVSLVDCNP